MPVINKIQVRRDSEADWASANPVLSQGEPGFETDTGKFKWGDGTTAWNSLDYAAGSASVVVSETAPVDVEVGGIWYNSAEGRAYIYYDSYFVELTPSIQGPPGKFSVSETEPADPVTGDAWFDASTAKLFLYYDSYWVEATGNYIGPEGPQGPAGPTGPAGADAQTPAGNAIINGAFEINQRNFSTSTTSNDMGFDRWRFNYTSGTTTYSAQTFTPGTAPVAGHEARNFARLAVTGQTGTNANAIFRQPIESVRTFAGQTISISFWAKANTGTPAVAVELTQNFGSGGTFSSDVNAYAGKVTLSTSWARYSVSVAVPSISGKSIGTNNNDSLLLTLWASAGSDFDARTGSLGIQNNTFDIWGVQLEAGSTATPFRRNANSIEGELAACQRYFQAWGNNSRAVGYNFSSTIALITFPFTVEMRVQPTAFTASSTANQFAVYHSGTSTNLSAVPTMWDNDAKSVTWQFTVSSGLTTGQGVAGRINNASAFLGASAEL